MEHMHRYMSHTNHIYTNKNEFNTKRWHDNVLFEYSELFWWISMLTMLCSYHLLGICGWHLALPIDFHLLLSTYTLNIFINM